MYFAHALVLLELSTYAIHVHRDTAVDIPAAVDDFSQEECRWSTYSALTDRQTFFFSVLSNTRVHCTKTYTIRGHLQTIFGKINVIVMLTFGPPPPLL